MHRIMAMYSAIRDQMAVDSGARVRQTTVILKIKGTISIAHTNVLNPLVSLYKALGMPLLHIPNFLFCQFFSDRLLLQRV